MHTYRNTFTVRLMAVVALVAAVLLLAASPASAKPHKLRAVTKSSVTWFAEPDRAIGWSKLARYEDRVEYRWRSSEFVPREAVTIWWVVFNNPSACSDACGADDIFVNGDATLGLDLDQIAATQAVGGYGGGTLADRHGVVTVRGSLGVGETGREVIAGVEPILLDSRTAEVHLVARTHGPAIPGLVDEQLGSYGGGCQVFNVPGVYPVGVGGCSDVQSSIHLP